jgi:ferredoxin
MTKTLILCDCEGSQAIDADAISSATGLQCSKVFTGLCMGQADRAAELIGTGDCVVACQQERVFFEELAEDLEADAPAFLDLRDRAGWSDEGAQAAPKMAALAAEAILPAPISKAVDVISEGTCLIIGRTDIALPTAQKLSDALAVTVFLTDAPDDLMSRDYDVITGTLRRASGALGAFSLVFDGLQQAMPGGRGALGFSDPVDGANSACDIILDLSGNPSLFPAPEKREGYLRADPGSPTAVADAMFAAAQMVGTFEKPLYVKMEPSLCAHSRAQKSACSNCLDICPTGAITSAGEHVAVDPMICAGCGACSAVCPSGAISYDAPTVDTVFRRLNTLASTYRKAGGINPRVLVHDAGDGAEMIRLAARFGRGLPANVIPFETEALAGFGHAEALAALGVGFADVTILLSPRTERDAPQRETALADALVPGRVRLLDVADPDAMSDALFDGSPEPVTADPILPIGTRRQVTRLVAKTLSPEAEIVDLPVTAPYGAVLVDTDACTLCLSCVSLCPSGALGDNPDLPQLRFQEDACLQCGLCVNVCPEKAITLQPQLNLTDGALRQEVLYEEEPFPCIKCGSLFGSKSTVERIMEKLAGKHAMFATPGAASMIQMCDNCRIDAQFHSQDNPFQGGERPRPRTTDDYLSKRKDH